MIGLTGGHICPLCGYRLPVQTITYTTGTDYGEYVKVIRCKDCKYWQDITEYRDFSICVDYGRSMNADDYCSKAERKEHETY